MRWVQWPLKKSIIYSLLPSTIYLFIIIYGRLNGAIKLLVQKKQLDLPLRL